ncbi:hypothetical protein ESCO_002024 [Escovopsis weberi]|uniref:Uncharacterized protein n=1 Tax=Escovopsis weberi TaxID=150374 RepID=A0A0M8N7K7_ESCWE|nr:hypothetical protein ESCO_002024 [Escovopsis weberi]
MLGSNLFERSRYFEALGRDPWWIFTAIKLVWAVKNTYNYTLTSLVQTSSRFGVMLFCVLLSIIFLVVDIAVTVHGSVDSGINPFWRFALVFKCASDVIFLDDFKSVLDHLSQRSTNRPHGFGYPSPLGVHRVDPGASNRPAKGVLNNFKDTVAVPVRAKSKCGWEEHSDNSGACWTELSHASERTIDDLDQNNRMC